MLRCESTAKVVLYTEQGKYRNIRHLKPSPTVGANPWPLRKA